ncbi:MAG: hypothetical protein R6W66_01690, partial [Pelovirga sp.]
QSKQQHLKADQQLFTMEDIMKRTVRNTLIALFAFSSSAFAAAASGAGEGSLLVSLFIGFFALIVVFQLVPATLMMIGMLKGLFGRDRKEISSHSR